MFLSCIHSYNYEELWADAHSYGYLTDMNWVFFTRILSIKSGNQMLRMFAHVPNDIYGRLSICPQA